MKMKKAYFLIVLFLCELSVGNLFAAAPVAGPLGQRLIEAAREGNGTEVERLIARGADVNATNQYGGTALMWAAIRGHENIVKMLLQEGADKDLQNVVGRTAEAIARDARYDGHNELADMIRDYTPSGRRIKAAR